MVCRMFFCSEFPNIVDLVCVNLSMSRSSRSLMFFKIGVLKNFAIFTGKDLHRSLFFNKVAPSLFKKRLQHRFFPVNTAKFLRTAFFIEHLWWLLSTFPPPLKGLQKGEFTPSV